MWRHNVLSLQCDAAHLPLNDASVDLIVTSPPYFAMRSYTDGSQPLKGQVGDEPDPAEYIGALLTCTEEWIRVLKPSGSIFVNMGDKYGRGSRTTLHGTNSKEGYVDRATGGDRRVRPTGHDKSLLGLPWWYALACMREFGLLLREEVIWNKVNGLPESAVDRCARKHEQLFHFTKQGRYYSAVDRIREEPADKNRKGRTWQERKNAGEPGRYGDTGVGASGAMVGGLAGHQAGKLPSSVWNIPTQPLCVPQHVAEDSLDDFTFDFRHYAAFPEALVQPIILGWSPKDGVVCDPFGGTGTTAITAAKMLRRGITCDLSYGYAKQLVEWRMYDLSQNRRN